MSILIPCVNVEVGTYSTVEMLVRALESSGSRLSNWARALLPQVTISPRSWLNVVTPSVAELGFIAEWTPIRDIYLRGQELGFQLVPSDLAFYLRLQCPDLPMYEAIFMAMEALNHPRGGMYLFCVGNDSFGRLVGNVIGHPESGFRLDSRFAFVVPQA